jgi:hypothetical protein
MHRDSRREVLNLFAEAERQAGKAPHESATRQIISFDVACADRTRVDVH